MFALNSPRLSIESVPAPFCFKRTCRGWRFTLALCAVVYSASGLATECLIEPERQIDLRFTVVGLVDTVTVKRGDRVTKGQVIATLESGAERAAADLAKFRSEQLGPTLAAEGKVSAAKQKYERRRLMAADGLMPLQERDDAKAELDQAEAELVIAKEAKQLAAIEWRQQLSLLALRTVRSPVDGVVSEQLVFPGEIVEPGDPKKPVIKLAQLDTLRARLVVPMQELGRYQVGQVLALQSETGQRISARVSVVDRAVNAASGFFSVYAAIANQKLTITAGVKCILTR